MNFDPYFELLVRLARQQAESRQFRHHANVRLFLFAIEIGLKRKLTAEEKSTYERTFRTAQLLSGAAQVETPPSSVNRILAGCVSGWLEWEPHVRAKLENCLGHSIEEHFYDHGISPELRRMVIDGLLLLFGNDVSAEEIATLIDRLEHPLDRA